MTRSGYVALAGRPNAGKSTLVNALVGHKVAIVSDKPQTTRRAIRGVLTHGDSQLVLVDLPGVQRPLDALTTRMQRRVEREVSDCDCALLLLNGDQGVGPGDRFIAKLLAGAGVPVVVVVNKVDRINRARTMEALTDAAALDVGDDVFAISARTGEGLPELVAHLEGLMPEGPFLFAADEISDQPRETLIAELIREQALRRTFQEVPHAVEVIVEELDESRADLIEIRATAWVEAESQKGILIGAGGAKIKSIGTAARKELERELGRRVHLDLSVRVRRSWRGDDQLLDRLGIE